MIIWGITGNSHDASLAVMKWSPNGLTDHYKLKLLWAGLSRDFSGKPGDPTLSNRMLAHVRSNALWAHPAKIIWYEKPFLKSLRQLWAGQGFTFTENNIKQFLQTKGIFQPVEYAKHHHSHAAYGYFTAPFYEKNAAIVVLDSIGEFQTFTIWHGKGEHLKQVYSQSYPHSVGLFYSAMTQRIGFKANAEEHKTERLAKKGNWRVHYRKFMEEIVLSKLPFKLRENLHRGANWWRPELTSEEDLANIAATTQKIFEQTLVCISSWCQMHIKASNIIFVGGCALNKSAIKHLEHIWDDIWIPPNPGDPGSCVGAVLTKYPHHVDFSADLWYNKRHTNGRQIETK